VLSPRPVLPVQRALFLSQGGLMIRRNPANPSVWLRPVTSVTLAHRPARPSTPLSPSFKTNHAVFLFFLLTFLYNERR
jgi:hypothetical protein